MSYIVLLYSKTRLEEWILPGQNEWRRHT